MVNVVNPFQAGNTEIGVIQLYQKPVGILPDPVISPLPYAPSSFSQSVNTANLSAAITGIEATLSLVDNGQIATFSDQEITALQNTLSVLTGASAPTLTLTAAQTQDIMVSVIAINNSTNSGAYQNATNDFSTINSNSQYVTFGSANTGWFPEGAQSLLCNDQYMIAELPGSGAFYWSNTANAADWSVLNTNSMEKYSDQPIAMDQLSDYVLSFGKLSLEVFQDTGLPVGPGTTTYEEVPGTTQNYGLGAVFSRAPFMNSIAFLGQNRTGQVHIFMLNGFVPQIISTPDIDRIINNFLTVSDAIAFSYDNNGQQFYEITFPTADGKYPRTFLYNGTLQSWSEVMSGVMSEYGRHLAGVAMTFNSTALVGDCQSGNVYILDPTNATDNGFLMRREFTTMHINTGGNRFTLAQIELEVDFGVEAQPIATNGGVPYTASIMLYWSTDNGNTWKGPKKKSLGPVGQYGKRLLWRKLGNARDFVLKFVVTDPIPITFNRVNAVVAPSTEQ